MAFANDPLSMDLSPALDGFAPTSGTIPVAVELRNDGPDAQGILKVTGNQFDMEYPIELPRGSQKRFLTYPTLDYGGLRYILILDRGRILKNFEPPPSSGNNVQTALLIGDTPGEMAFLRGSSASETAAATTGQVGVLKDAYVKPLDAPNRPVGYANLCAVVLGAGADRLNDEQVQSLKTFAMTGGTLVFVGGASAPILADARWQDTLPATDFHSVNLRHSDALDDLGDAATPPTSVMSGTPITGATTRKDGRVLITAERPFGLGKVVYIAFNPFELPLSRWEGRELALQKVIRVIDYVQSSQLLQQYLGTSGSVSYGYGAPPPSGPISFSTATGRYGERVAQDPFSTTLPPVGRVFSILGAYFLVVVPLNFLVLKKLRRGELAWITAPIISLGFAGAFFASAQGLYSAKMSSAAQGIILAQEGMPYGMFVGDSQMFIPSSGSYDLKLKGVDSFGIVRSDSPYGYSGNDLNSADLNPQDTGEITIPDMRANNLAFRQISYRQRVPVTDWYSIEFQRTGSTTGRCFVRNTGPYVLRAAEILANGVQKDIGDLKPGDAQTVDIDVKPRQKTTGDNEIAGVLSRIHGVGLVGTIEGFRPGPQIGDQVADRTYVRLTLVAKEGFEGR